jgi:hypothetical protein
MAAVGQALDWGVATESDLPAAADARGGESNALFGKFSGSEAEVKIGARRRSQGAAALRSGRLKAKYSQSRFTDSSFHYGRLASFSTEIDESVVWKIPRLKN